MKWTAGLALLLLPACVVFPEVTDRNARILAMGDSVIAWNREDGASIADALERRLGQPVVDASVPGAKMRQDGLRGSLGFSIPEQYRAGRWDAVIVNGGANDLLSQCNCTRCDATLDRLVRQDYPALVNRLDDTQVFIVGYYGAAGDRPGRFNSCDNELQQMERRLTVLFADRSNVHVVRVRDAITGRPTLYDNDRVHPSPAGSRVMAELVARALVANSSPSR
ncbi:MAG: SGNH/GDSL hydrolase family protein [Silicimonas sp.]|nr:SGNH/GDSL hydrolase family protein [Silicimonas sp.]